MFYWIWNIFPPTVINNGNFITCCNALDRDPGPSTEEESTSGVPTAVADMLLMLSSTAYSWNGICSFSSFCGLVGTQHWQAQQVTLMQVPPWHTCIYLKTTSNSNKKITIAYQLFTENIPFMSTTKFQTIGRLTMRCLKLCIIKHNKYNAEINKLLFKYFIEDLILIIMN